MTARHEYGDSFTGMLCGALVTDEYGHGDECGLPATDPVHFGYQRTILRQALFEVGRGVAARFSDVELEQLEELIRWKLDVAPDTHARFTTFRANDGSLSYARLTVRSRMGGEWNFEMEPEDAQALFDEMRQALEG